MKQLMKVSVGKCKVRAKISFQLYFQEIYDFELVFSALRLSRLLTCKEILRRLVDDGAEDPTVVGRASVVDLNPRSSRLSRVSSGFEKLDDESNVGKVLVIDTPSNRKHWSRGRRVASTLSKSRHPEWAKMCKIQFRGTVSDLNNAHLDVTLFTTESPSDLKVKRTPPGSRWWWTAARTPASTTKVLLKGVADQMAIKTSLLPAPWMKAEGKHGQLQCGLLEGCVSVEHRPRFYQLDDVSDDLDFHKRYLFVNVVKVDRIFTPDTRPLDEIDPFVEVRGGKVQVSSLRGFVSHMSLTCTRCESLVFLVSSEY